MARELTLEQLQTEASALAEQIKTVRATKDANARAAALYEASASDEKSLWNKLHRIETKMEHLTRYDNNKELQRIVALFTQAAEENWQTFKFFDYAEADFAQTKAEGRRLHIKLVCTQVCDHDVKTVLQNAEKVAGKKIMDWFVSASIGSSYKYDAAAWLTYHLTFDGANP